MKTIISKTIGLIKTINFYILIPYYIFRGTIFFTYFLVLYVIGYVREWNQLFGLAFQLFNLFILFIYWIYIQRFEFKGCFFRTIGWILALWAMLWSILFISMDIYSVRECNKLMRRGACKTIDKNDRIKLYINCVLFGGMFKVNSRDICIGNLENSCEKCKEMNKTYYHEETAIIILDSLKKR